MPRTRIIYLDETLPIFNICKNIQKKLPNPLFIKSKKSRCRFTHDKLIFY